MVKDLVVRVVFPKVVIQQHLLEVVVDLVVLKVLHLVEFMVEEELVITVQEVVEMVVLDLYGLEMKEHFLQHVQLMSN
jgi:hypothetical protein